MPLIIKRVRGSDSDARRVGRVVLYLNGSLYVAHNIELDAFRVDVFECGIFGFDVYIYMVGTSRLTG